MRARTSALLLAVVVPCHGFTTMHMGTTMAATQGHVQQHTRRGVLSRAVAGAVALAVPAVATLAPAVATLAPAAALAEDASSEAGVDKVISYLEFNELLFKRKLTSALFRGNAYQECIVTLEDGTTALIGPGYPHESPSTDESPMKVVAQLRNAGVPYRVDFQLRGYTYARAYKSKDTLAAEGRQREEDEAVERRMREQDAAAMTDALP